VVRAHVASYLDDFRRYGRATAVVRYRGNRRSATSYGELAELAGRVAMLLVERGVGAGDRVLLWGENGAEWIAAFYGCALRGAVVVPLDAGGSAEFARRVCADVRPVLAFGDGPLLEQLPHEWPRLAFAEGPAALPTEQAGAIAGLTLETPLQILFTSGTTGDPKGIVHTHGNVLASVAPIEQGAQRYLRYARPFHPLRFLHTLPLSHVFGQMMGLWVPPIFAAEVHFEERAAGARLVEIIHRERISVLAAVPRVLALLKTHLEMAVPSLERRIVDAQGSSAWKRWWLFRDMHRATGFKFWALVCGGGALPSAVEQFWRAVGYLVVQGYGMTETTALITLNHPFHVKNGSIGKPMPGREVKLGPDGELLVRGPMISTATWIGGALRQRSDEWLATGDLAEALPSGEMRFLGRKSEVIVTAAGVNLHPEDLEAALEQEPGVLACAVVAMETANGPEPCAVLSFRTATAEAAAEQAAAAVQSANGRLAETQRLRRWRLWPGPDLPRTSTGKVRRKVVAQWLQTEQSASARDGAASSTGAGEWLLDILSRITGETIVEAADDARLGEDLHLDSLGRVQLAAAIEEGMGGAGESLDLEQARTLGDLRRLVNPAADTTASLSQEREVTATLAHVAGSGLAAAKPAPEAATFLYPRWPWWWPVRWLRSAFVEAVMRPLVWLLVKPEVVNVASAAVTDDGPYLVICNHVSSFDAPLLEYALAGAVRRRMAVAMSGEMLEAYRHWRNPESRKAGSGFYLFGPLVYLLLTALFNVFPLPRFRNFQRSFAHAGAALDRGFHVLVFPEGTRSPDGTLAEFRSGIGLLVRQSGAAVLPVALCGLGELKTGRNRWFRPGTLQVRVGQPLRFAEDTPEREITERLHAEMQRLLQG